MRKILFLGVLLLAGCTARAESDVDMLEGVKNWNATLEPRTGSEILGSATVQSSTAPGFAGTTAAAVSIGRAAAGAQHPWHVHVGTCATGGPIFGPAAAYPVLQAGNDGNASATANVPTALDPNASYHINIHRSPSELGTIVSCGDLR